MNRCVHLAILGALLALPATGQESPPPLSYAVVFKDQVVATQTVAIVHSGDRTTISCSFAADLPVFVATHHVAEQLSVTFRRTDGTVERLGARLQDGPNLTVVSGALASNDALRIVRTDMDGVATSVVARSDYDFHSLVFYGRAPADFLTTNVPARVLSIARGEVRPIGIQTIAESDTFERQYLVSTHLVWTDGAHVSHSWHPERFSNLPRRYVRRTDAGEFVFQLIR